MFSRYKYPWESFWGLGGDCGINMFNDTFNSCDSSMFDD